MTCVCSLDQWLHGLLGACKIYFSLSPSPGTTAVSGVSATMKNCNQISNSFKIDIEKYVYILSQISLITTKLCTYLDSCAFLISANFHCVQIRFLYTAVMFHHQIRNFIIASLVGQQEFDVIRLLPHLNQDHRRPTFGGIMVSNQMYTNVVSGSNIEWHLISPLHC